MKLKHSVPAILLLSLLLSACGCQKSTPYDLSYREKSFCASMEGNQFGMDFCCDIYCEEGRMKKIVYSSPESLKGVTVYLLENGSIKIEKDKISAPFPQNAGFKGLLLPASRLLLEGFDQSFVNTVQKIPDGFYLSLSLPNESQTIYLTLAQNGFPTVLSGSDFSYRVHLNDED